MNSLLEHFRKNYSLLKPTFADPVLTAHFAEVLKSVDLCTKPIQSAVVLRAKVGRLNQALIELGDVATPTPRKGVNRRESAPPFDIEQFRTEIRELIVEQQSKFADMVRSILAEQQPKADPMRVDIKELAKRLGKSQRTIAEWKRLRKIPFEKIGRNVMFDITDVNASLKKYKRTAGD